MAVEATWERVSKYHRQEERQGQGKRGIFRRSQGEFSTGKKEGKKPDRRLKGDWGR